MATEHFCLRWNNHQSTLVSVFDNLLESGTLVDCTLAADGRYLKAHKVVLSACSPYLGMLLSQHYDKHPIIILKDVKFDELKAMLDYMYRGEVNISQEQLSTFLKAAETLQIKGLTDAGSDEGNGLQPNRPPSSNSTTSANEDPPSPGPPGEGGSSPGPRKRKRNKHGDDGEGDSVSKISLSEGSDRLSATSVGSPSAGGGRSASVKREPADGEGDGQMSVDDSGEVVMMSRPGPSNGGTNNKAPWILSADSSGEEMQLTPGQAWTCITAHATLALPPAASDFFVSCPHPCCRPQAPSLLQSSASIPTHPHDHNNIAVATSSLFSSHHMSITPVPACHPLTQCLLIQDGGPREPGLKGQESKKEVVGYGRLLEVKREIKEEVNCLEDETNPWQEKNRSDLQMKNPEIVFRLERSEGDLIIPDPLEEPLLLVKNVSKNYLPSENSLFATVQREDKSEGSNEEGCVSEDNYSRDYHLLEELSSVVEQQIMEAPSREKVRGCIKNNLLMKMVPKSSYTKSSKSQHSSVTVIDFNDISQNKLTSTSHSTTSSVKYSKTVVDVADVFNEKQVTVKKTKLDFHVPKCRRILPVPKDNLAISKKESKCVQNVQPTEFSNQPINTTPPQCSISPSDRGVFIRAMNGKGISSIASDQVDNIFNHQENQGSVVDVFNENNVRKKESKLNFHVSKYRRILPAPKKNSVISGKKIHRAQNVQPTESFKQPININSAQCSISPSDRGAMNKNETSTIASDHSVNTLNHQDTLSSPLSDTSSTTSLLFSQHIQVGQLRNSKPSLLSIPQQLQVAKIRSPNPTLVSIPQQLQGSQIINNTPRMISIPQVQASQLSSSSSATLSLAPQFSISPSIHTANIHMQFASPNCKSHIVNFENAQSFTNSNLQKNEIGYTHGGLKVQPVSHSFFVTPNIISSCQTSNQIIPPTSICSKFNTPTAQPNFRVPASPCNLNCATSQPNIIPLTPASTFIPENKKHSAYVNTPGGFVQATSLTPDGGQAVKNTPGHKDQKHYQGTRR